MLWFYFCSSYGTEMENGHLHTIIEWSLGLWIFVLYMRVFLRIHSIYYVYG